MRVSIISCALLYTLLGVTEGIKCYMRANGRMKEYDCPTTNYCLIISSATEGTARSFCDTPDLEAFVQNPTMREGLDAIKYILNETSGSTKCESAMKKSASITDKGQSVTVYATCCGTDLCNSSPALQSLLTVPVVTLFAFFLR